MNHGTVHCRTGLVVKSKVTFDSFLVVCDLALVTASDDTQGYKLLIRKDKWESFRDEYKLNIEVESKKWDWDAQIAGTKPDRNNRVRLYVIQIGKTYDGSPRKIEDQLNRCGDFDSIPPVLEKSIHDRRNFDMRQCLSIQRLKLKTHC